MPFFSGEYLTSVIENLGVSVSGVARFDQSRCCVRVLIRPTVPNFEACMGGKMGWPVGTTDSFGVHSGVESMPQNEQQKATTMMAARRWSDW